MCQELEKQDNNPEKSDEETEKKPKNDEEEEELEAEEYEEEDLEEVCSPVESNLLYNVICGEVVNLINRLVCV